jgi:hypothetical protein
MAAVVTSTWSYFDRRRTHPGLYRWFRVFIRFALGATLVQYGLSKVIPLQMPTVSLTRLVQPFGDLSPMGVLWSSIGASPAYEVTVGSAELLAGVLLFWPRTAPLGTLFCLVTTGQVFVLNMSYDVPVKLLSFHLVLLALFLAAPNARRLFELFLLGRPTRLREEPPLGSRDRAHRVGAAAQLVFGAYLVSMCLYGSIQGWRQYGDGAPRSPLFGIWAVEHMLVDGDVRPPLLTDSGRWRHVIFQSPTTAVFQRMDNSFVRHGAAIDVEHNTLALTSANGKATAMLTFDRPTAEQLVLDGEMDERRVHLELTRRAMGSFLLTSRGFNWVQEVPLNR